MEKRARTRDTGLLTADRPSLFLCLSRSHRLSFRFDFL
uniref:Uncharacterized protein n=1 Tax=Rhizophora mucronata TaxID=61149 RepID=A0A2P2KEH2_RHIMU